MLSYPVQYLINGHNQMVSLFHSDVGRRAGEISYYIAHQPKCKMSRSALHYIMYKPIVKQPRDEYLTRCMYDNDITILTVRRLTKARKNQVPPQNAPNPKPEPKPETQPDFQTQPASLGKVRKFIP